MSDRTVGSKVILVFINVGILLGMALGYKNYHVDKFSLVVIGCISLVALNGMFFLFRTDPNLPPVRVRQLNKWVLWPIVFLAALIVLVEMFSKGS